MHRAVKPPLKTRREILGVLIGASVGLVAPNLAFGKVPTIGKLPGRPQVRLDRLTFPKDIPGAPGYIRHLRSTLRRHAAQVDWGAGRDSTISFRFAVEKLQLTRQGSALRVHCSARGELPRGRTALSRLVYGGDPKQTQKLVRQVLTIVARGVVTRLAALERSRRQG